MDKESRRAKNGKTGEATPDICDNCGSERLLKVKGCVRCQQCGFKGDCNGW